MVSLPDKTVDWTNEEVDVELRRGITRKYIPTLMCFDEITKGLYILYITCAVSSSDVFP